MSGWLVVMALATCFNRVVLPAFGGDTIIPRCPLPMGDRRSSTRMATDVFTPGISICRRWLGKMGVKSSKLGLVSVALKGYPFTVLI